MATPSAGLTSGGNSSTRRAKPVPTSGRSWSFPSASLPTRSGLPTILAANPNYRGKTLFEVLFRNGNVDKFATSEIPDEYENRESKAFGFYVQKGLFEEYAEFGRHHGHDLAPFDTYQESRGLRWPVVDGKETKWRYREGYDPYVKSGKGVEFYGQPDGRAKIIAVPYEPPAESPTTRNTTPGWLPAESWSIGTRGP